MESELQFVVRHVVAEVLRTEREEADEALAERLASADLAALAELRTSIETVSRRWTHEHHLIAFHDEHMYWCLTPSREELPDDGTVVTLSWGMHDQRCVKMSGQDAIDMAVRLLKLFEQSDGSFEDPTPPTTRDLSERSPEAVRFFEHFNAVASELSARGLDQGVSLMDAEAWVASGRPDVPLRHAWVAFPEDHVEVCSVCGHYFWTNRDNWGSIVCWGKPLRDTSFQSTHEWDPRRSPALREAQRLDHIVDVLQKLFATDDERAPFLEHLSSEVTALDPADLARFEKERVGINDAKR